MISFREFLLRLTCPYNVNDIYITTSEENPSTTWPWTAWEEFAAGKQLIGVDVLDDNFNAVGRTGGAKGAWYHTHEHSPKSHTHGWNLFINTTNTSSNTVPHYRAITNRTTTLTNTTASSANIGYSGDNVTPPTDVDKANLQPYKVVRMWRRVT